MKWITLVSVFVSACSVDTASSVSPITGGTPESGYAAVFALAYNGEGGCSGTCITPKVGITATHCVEGEPASILSALFGPTEAAPTKTVKVAALATEPTGADLALLAFSEACPATIPYNRTALETHVGEPVVMVGFGVTTENANDAGIKRSGTATLYSVTPTNVPGMKAGELATSNDPDGTCNGDSGGPTFMTFESVEYMVGVTSRGSLMNATTEYPCGQGRSIAVRADTYATFINSFIAMHDPDADGEPPDGDGDGSGSGSGSGSGEPPGNDPTSEPGGCATTRDATLWLALGLLGLLALRRRPRKC